MSYRTNRHSCYDLEYHDAGVKTSLLYMTNSKELEK